MYSATEQKSRFFSKLACSVLSTYNIYLAIIRLNLYAFPVTESAGYDELLTSKIVRDVYV